MMRQSYHGGTLLAAVVCPLCTSTLLTRARNAALWQLDMHLAHEQHECAVLTHGGTALAACTLPSLISAMLTSVSQLSG